MEDSKNDFFDQDKKSSGFSNDKFFNEFEKIINDSFMNPSLSLNDVSSSLSISSNYLSQIINAKNISFNDYLNSVRIEKVKSMLAEDKFSNYTITAIGLEAGFNSNASFYRAFKKYTGISPSNYRKK
jgi:YesN/AraC family two-component response regulator